MRWAQSVGCECSTGYNELTGMNCVRIVSPAGRQLLIAGSDQAERLVSSVLNHYDRRLGLESPFDRVKDA
jgi:hypothetical protein